MRIAVIGGAGYIGSHVVLALQDAGHKPVIFDNLSTGARENAQCELVEGDILDYPALVRFLSRGFDAVVHLAARKAAGESMRVPESYAQTNIVGTINVLGAMVAAGVKRLIFSSTAAVYGDPTYVPMDEQHPTRPINFYGFTKLEIERIMQWYSDLHGLRCVALRYFNAAGYDAQGRVRVPERDPANLLPILLEAAAGARSSVQVYGDDYETPDGTCVRDYVHVSDLAAGHVAALSYLDRSPWGVFNLGTGKGVSVKECVQTVQRLCGPFVVVMGPRRAGDPAVVVTDASLAARELGWTATQSDIESLVRSMWPLYKK